MFKFPVTYFEKNLIFNLNGECWAGFKLKNFNYDHISTERKIGILNSLARFIANSGEEAKILIIPVMQDVETHFKHIIKKLDTNDELYDITKAHAEGTKEYLQARQQKGNVNDYTVYVIAKLKASKDIVKSVKDAISFFVREPMQAAKQFIGTDNADILERKAKQFKALAEDFFKSQGRRLEIMPITPEDTQWLIRRMFFRGLTDETELRYNRGEKGNTPWVPFVETFKNEKGELVKRPYKKDVLNLTTGLIDLTESRSLLIHHGKEKTSHQAFLPLVHIPDGLEFPGNEWIIFLQEMEFEVEICIHIENIEHKDSIKKVEGKRKEITNQIDHIVKNAEDVPDDLLNGRDYADQLEAELKASKAPLSRASITIALSADSKKTLEDRVRELKSQFSDGNFILERPVSDQEKLFMEFIPGAGRYMKDYIIPLPPRTLAGGLFGASCHIGDSEGQYVGTVGKLGRNVFLDLLLACLRNRSASAFAWGDLGFGKSFNMNLLFYLAVMYGAKGLVIDPKGERTKWLHELPELEGMISVITLGTGQEDKGKLDPWNIYKDDPEEAGALALTILAEIFKLKPSDDEYLCHLEAINWVKQQEVRSMNLHAQKLENFEEGDDFKKTAEKAARKIRLLRQMGMAGLLFGDGSEQGLNFNNRINILQIQNMKMPNANVPKEEYTEEELLSAVLMLPIANFAKKFALSNPGQPKINLMDESWALSVTRQGQSLFEYLARTGRSLFTGTIFIGHSTKDIASEGVRNALSYKFCFHITDIEETKRSLELLEMEVTDENIAKVQSLKNGQCLFKDLDGRIGTLNFDVVYDHLIQAFMTTPKKQGGETVE